MDKELQKEAERLAVIDMDDAIERGDQYADLLRRLRAVMVLGPVCRESALALANAIFVQLSTFNDTEDEQ